MTKSFDRGQLQAIVAKHMSQHKINKNSKPETKTKAFTAAAKDLGDGDDLSRARQIGNWMLRHDYKPGEIAKRLSAKAAAKAPAKKAKAKSKKASTPTTEVSAAA